MGVTVTFIAILELMKEGMLEIVQAEPYAPIHVRPASGSRQLTVVENNADAENEAALAQPAQPEEDEDDDVEMNVADSIDVEAQAAEESAADATALQETSE